MAPTADVELIAVGKRYGSAAARGPPALTRLDQTSPGIDVSSSITIGQAAMTTTLNLYQAKTQLSKLVERAAAGEEIVIAKAGKPMARLVPLARPKKPRQPGFLKGKIWIADDFDEWPEDILASFEADIEPPEDDDDDDAADGKR